MSATASTTFDEPFHVARRFASLDHISGGRAGWNIVTTANPYSAWNFGYEEQPQHAARYTARENFTMSSRAFGTASRTTHSSGMRKAGSSSIPIDFMFSITRGRNFPFVVRSISRGRSRAGLSSSSAAGRIPDASSRLKRRKPCSPPRRHSNPASASTQMSKDE